MIEKIIQSQANFTKDIFNSTNNIRIKLICEKNLDTLTKYLEKYLYGN